VKIHGLWAGVVGSVCSAAPYGRQLNDCRIVRGPFKFDQKGDPTLVTHMVRIVDVKETDARS
jgi:hypothetical protein